MNVNSNQNTTSVFTPYDPDMFNSEVPFFVGLLILIIGVVFILIRVFKKRAK